MSDAESPAELPLATSLAATAPIISILPKDCPPADANSHAGQVFRLVKADPATIDDFKTYFDLYPGRQWTTREACPAHGLSIRLTLAAAIAEAKKMRSRIKAAHWEVAVATLGPKDGHVLQTFTDPNHHTWWPSHQTDFLAIFSVQKNAVQ
jgi:hypothetical protein